MRRIFILSYSEPCASVGLVAKSLAKAQIHIGLLGRWSQGVFLRHDPFIDQFVVDYHTKHTGVDKVTITPTLKDACQGRGIKPPSESMVGKIISDLKANGRLPQKSKVTLNGCPGRLPRKVMKKSRRKGFCPKLPRELVEINRVDIFADAARREGLIHYFNDPRHPSPMATWRGLTAPFRSNLLLTIQT